MTAFLNLLDGSSIQQPLPKPLPADGQVKVCGKICQSQKVGMLMAQPSYQPGFSKGTAYLYIYIYVQICMHIRYGIYQTGLNAMVLGV